MVATLEYQALTDGQIVDRFNQSVEEKEDVSAQIRLFQELVMRGSVDTLVPLLPLLLRLEGAPYTLDGHMHFEDRFRIRYAQRSVYRTGRQVAKSTGHAASMVIRSASIPNYSTLVVTPLFDQVRIFSTERVKKFIDDSPIRRLVTSTQTKNNVLMRTFTNGSRIHFSFAGLSCDRIRGITAHEVDYDEVQDMNREHIPIINSCMSASPYEISCWTGTPKTEDNTLEGLWNRSSMGEWFIPCTHCTTNGFPTWNIPAEEYHLDAMIDPEGLDLSDISRERPALRCFKCRGRISPRHGRWVHRHPDRRFLFDGFHISQPIVPLHCEKQNKWRSLLDYRHNYPRARFMNEVLGEACDLAAKLVTQTDIQKVAILGPNDARTAKSRMRMYRYTVLGVDWGGGGEEEVSWTAVALCGIRNDGRIDVIWGARLDTPNDHLREAKEILRAWQYFKPNYLAHDYNGSGALREVFLHQARGGVKTHQIFPVVYGRAATKAPVLHKPPTDIHPRDHYFVDKTRAILTVTALLKMGWIQTFNYDHVDADNPGLLHDFVALTQAKTQTMIGDTYRIDKQEGLSDDFAHAVTFACACLWHRTKVWPNLPAINAMLASEEMLNALDGGEWNPEDLN